VSEPEHRPAHLRPATVEISRFWSPEMALAVFELIDDLRDKILAVHGNQIHELLKEQRGLVDPGGGGDARDDEQPF
jgi:uroporphyrinogen-III synthase